MSLPKIPRKGIDLATSLVEQKPPSPSALRDTDGLCGEKCAGGWVDLADDQRPVSAHTPEAAVHAGVGICEKSRGPGRRFPKTHVHLGVRCWSTDFFRSAIAWGLPVVGRFATYAVAPQNAVHRIPDGLLSMSCCLLAL